MTSLIGKRAYIKPNSGDADWNDEYKNAWGTIIDYDGEYYHIQMFCDGTDNTASALIFKRNEFTVRRR